MCLPAFLKYTDNEQVYTAAERVTIPDYANGWTLKNNGNTNVVLNQSETIAPGGSKSIGGNYGEIYDGIINIRFTLPTPAPGTPLNKAVFTFKCYTGTKNVPKDQKNWIS